MTINIIHGDCMDVLKSMPDNSIDSCVTDPPYALNFMGKKWDTGEVAFSVALWREVLRVLKPGGHLLAFGGTRTCHRMTCAIEDAGFEIRDRIRDEQAFDTKYGAFVDGLDDAQRGVLFELMNDYLDGGSEIAWMYGTGMPKSHDVSKAIDRAAGVAREIVGTARGKGGQNLNQLARKDGGDSDEAKGCGAFGSGAQQVDIDIPVTAPATDAARQWQGWGTALKPAFEPIVLARKPLGTGDVDVRRNVEKELRKCGITSEIVWVEESAETANCLKKNTNSPRERQASFVENAIANEITNTALETSTKPENPVVDGTQITVRNTSTIRSDGTASYANKSSSTTDANAPAVENANRISSLLTTSTEAERNTENLSDKRSTQTSANVVSPLDSEHFAGIATGLTDSMEHVHIKRKGGSFVWPKELPTFVPSRPLTVAANVLRWGTGALNIDGCRVPTDDVAEIGKPSWGGPMKRLSGAPGQEGKLVPRTQPHNGGRWPANVVLSYPEDTYELRADVTAEQRAELGVWLAANS